MFLKEREFSVSLDLSMHTDLSVVRVEAKTADSAFPNLKLWG